MTGLEIRQFFRELFGSRVAETLEEAAMRQREQYEYRLQDKDRIIADLRSELALVRTKCDLFEKTLIPIVSPAGDFLRGPQPPLTQLVTEPDPNSWAGIQARHMKTEFAADEEDKSDGVSN